MKRTFDASRRRFLSTAGALSAAGPVAAPLALNLAGIGAAAAQSCPSDYKALVCIYLAGGNDSYNMVVPTDASSVQAYERARGSQVGPKPLVVLTGDSANPIAIPTTEAAVAPMNAIALSPLVPLPGGRTVALHPEMTHAEQLFDLERRLAIVPNVGPLLYPIASAEEYRTFSAQRKLPPRLFSHNDQTSTWQAFAPEGATRGWGGLLGDLFASCNGTRSTFTSISASGNVVWLAGETTMQYQVTTSGAQTVPSTSGALYGAAGGGTTLSRIASGLRRDGSARGDVHLIAQEQASVTARAIALGADLNGLLLPTGALATAPTWSSVNTQAPASAANRLADQLRIVARIIGGARKAGSGIRRQVFMVQIGSFDTHDRQLPGHASLMGRLSQALQYFDQLLADPDVNARDAVTTFTASEFGRTFGSNGDGTDHGWGAHHFVMGGAVDGGKVLGAMPEMGLTAPRTVARGSTIPTVSVDQYAARLASWFGASPSDLARLFPNLGRFDAAALPNLFKA
ncbi:MAG: hypothetical protein RJA99_4527 [Pseudomonadota bacterium]|jgi:uncharacterized protein (DUF1501 family)